LLETIHVVKQVVRVMSKIACGFLIAVKEIINVMLLVLLQIT